MIVLDTCTLLWLVRGEGLPPAVARAIDEADAAFVSAISALEIGTKVNKGRLTLGMPTRAWWAGALEQHGLAEVPVEGDIALRAAELPPIHADPADRVVLATAMHLRATLWTPDPLIRAYPGVEVAWG
jgi:PIN domain nuclease of toxin-antitoxin system